jgi:uncharacterized membrane protein YbhN (UPF0104 family)
MVGAMLAGTGSLAVLLVAGVAAAGAAGPLAAARLPLLYGLGALLLAAALLRRPAAALGRGLLARLAPELPRRLELSRRALAAIVGTAFANWLLDVVCLYVSLRAMHASAPLQAILPAFALAQLVASIPLLPGGGGTVEATLALGLAALGHTSGSVLAGILLFRLVSCWGLVPVGWLVLALDGRRPPRLAHARRRLAPVQASLALPLGATGPGARVGS